MIIFNTRKKAEHWVKWESRFDYDRGGYDWESRHTYISGNLVLQREAGDSCGCGCGLYIYDITRVVGRIKDKRGKSLSQVLEGI